MSDDGPVRVLGISGSLRKDSFNSRLLRAAQELAPEGMTIETFDLAGVPLYNGDLDTDALRPEAVVRLKEAIGRADALLVATPEYNYGVPGVLKNAIDWASRPGHRSVFVRKPVAIMGASTSLIGTARAQGQLKQTLLSVLAAVLPHPEVVVASAKERFDAEGRLTDEKTCGFVRDLLVALAVWTRQLR